MPPAIAALLGGGSGAGGGGTGFGASGLQTHQSRMLTRQDAHYARCVSLAFKLRLKSADGRGSGIAAPSVTSA